MEDMRAFPRPEHPRPDFERSRWLNLNGQWDFDFDDGNRGEKEKWYKNHLFSRSIAVPFAFECPASGIGDPSPHDVVWYGRSFDLPAGFRGRRVRLRFGAADFITRVWVNGQFAGEHTGGYSSFLFDITNLVRPKGNRLAVRCEDHMADTSQPRGKQSWKGDNFGCWYERTTGIWQTVWLEAAPELYIEGVRMTPDLEAGCIGFEVSLSGEPVGPVELSAEISFQGKAVTAVTVSSDMRDFSLSTGVADKDNLWGVWTWTPENPNLYDVWFTLKAKGQPDDVVTSYFGMRSVDARGGRVELNGAPYYLRLVLDQGYYDRGWLTAASDEDFVRDIEYTKRLGYNGVRKHQKAEDPRYFYWADRLGLLVFSEMGSPYGFGDRMLQYNYAEWQASLLRDFNHPCIIGWTLLNESWGVPDIRTNGRQQAHAQALYHMAKSFDPTRLAVTNDGWENAGGDLVNFHDYEQGWKELLKRYDGRAALTGKLVCSGRRYAFAEGFRDEGQPVVFSELGGTSFADGSGWGYGQGADGEAGYLQRYRELMTAVCHMDFLAGFCVTQLTDVRQEVNGMLTMDRKPKCDVEAFARIIRGEDLIREDRA